MTKYKNRVLNIINLHPTIFILLFVIFFIVTSCYFFIITSSTTSASDHYSIIIDFEKNYVQNKNQNSKYNFIETINFETPNHQKYIYSGTNENNNNTIVFSFVQSNSSINYSVIVTDTEGNEKLYNGGIDYKGFDNNIAICINLKPKDSYQLLCEPREENLQNDNLIHGKLNIYSKKTT